MCVESNWFVISFVQLSKAQIYYILNEEHFPQYERATVYWFVNS